MALFSARTLILGGLAAGAAYALRNNPTVKGLLGGGDSSAPATYSPGGRDDFTPASPVANVDVAGPPENTSTHVPAPEPAVHAPAGGIDELAEEQAAAAEAANIGGVPEEYPSEEDSTVPVDEALRPLEEAGEGYSEGQELAEADLVDNAEVAAGDPNEGERAIEDVIEAQEDPFSGESDEATLQMDLVREDDAPPPTGEPVADVPPPAADADAPEAAAITPSGTALPEESTPSGERPAEEKSAAVWQRDTDEKLDDGTS